MGGWGRDRKQPHVYDENGRLIHYKNPTNLMEVCVPIVDINSCRNNYIVDNAKKKFKGMHKLSDFKQKVERQVDWVYDGTNICAGSSSKDSCQVRSPIAGLGIHTGSLAKT